MHHLAQRAPVDPVVQAEGRVLRGDHRGDGGRARPLLGARGCARLRSPWNRPRLASGSRRGVDEGGKASTRAGEQARPAPVRPRGCRAPQRAWDGAVVPRGESLAQGCAADKAACRPRRSGLAIDYIFSMYVRLVQGARAGFPVHAKRGRNPLMEKDPAVRENALVFPVFGAETHPGHHCASGGVDGRLPSFDLDFALVALSMPKMRRPSPSSRSPGAQANPRTSPSFRTRSKGANESPQPQILTLSRLFTPVVRTDEISSSHVPCPQHS